MKKKHSPLNVTVTKLKLLNVDIKLVFSSFKIGNLFGVKDPIRRAAVIHKFLCGGCDDYSLGETTTLAHLQS